MEPRRSSARRMGLPTREGKTAGVHSAYGRALRSNELTMFWEVGSCITNFDELGIETLLAMDHVQAIALTHSSSVVHNERRFCHDIASDQSVDDF